MDSYEIKNIDFYGLKLSLLSHIQFREYILAKINRSEKIVIYGFSLGSIVYAKKVPEILLGNEADISLIDGQGLYYLLKFSKFQIRGCLSIPNSIFEILGIANKNGFSIMLYGSDADTNLKASNNITVKYPKAQVLAGIDGFTYSIEESIMIINERKPDIILIGISSPIKEIIAFRYKHELSAKVIVPCGGMIDVISGKTKQTNSFLKKIGAASLVRVFQEPKRLYKRYLFIYFQIFFNFLPRFIYLTTVKKGRFTIPTMLKIKSM